MNDTSLDTLLDPPYRVADHRIFFDITMQSKSDRSAAHTSLSAHWYQFNPNVTCQPPIFPAIDTYCNRRKQSKPCPDRELDVFSVTTPAAGGQSSGGGINANLHGVMPPY
jgi:hypothetical protein